MKRKGSQKEKPEISALLEGARAVLRYRDFAECARAIFDSCKHLIGATSGYVALLSKDGTENELVFLDSGGLPCTVPHDLPMPIRGLRAEAYHTGITVWDNHFTESEWKKFLPEGHVMLDNVLFAPLVLDGRTLGLLGLANKPGGFTRDDGRMATTFGDFAAMALQNSRTLESLENSEKRFRAVAQTATDAIISTDREGKIIFWNRAAEVMFGYSMEEALRGGLERIIPEPLRVAHRQGMKGFRSGGARRITGETIELTGMRKGGEEFPIELSLSSWDQNGDVFFTAILRDITERKRVEAELRARSLELQKRVKELGCLLEIFRLRETENLSLDEIFRTVVEIIPPAYQYPDETCARITVEAKTYATAGFKETNWKLESPVMVDGKVSGKVEVRLREAKPEVWEGPFLREERNLIDAIAGRLGHIAEAERAKESLHKAHDELEMRVAERTAELSKSNVLLMQEIAERKKAEEALKESEKAVRYLASKLIEAQERERRFVAQDIHDTLGASLAAVKFRLERSLSEPKVSPVLEDTVRMIQHTMEEARRIQLALHPSMLDDLGILATLSWFNREFCKTYSGIRIESQLDLKEDEVPKPLKTVIYRILQEAFNNLAKHSRADLVRVALRKKDGAVELIIEDNGIGFDADRARLSGDSGTGLGLSSMRERAEFAGGWVAIRSEPGQGTTVRAMWPQAGEAS
jgi:PAS domain S-box-containing protein